jgi:hypothetical protein
MIVTVLWEDQRGGDARGFGPHELLLSCLVDDLTIPREQLNGRIKSLPKKGRDKLREALKHEIRRFTKLGPVLAVIDKDKARDLWKGQTPPPPPCMSGMVSRLHDDAPGDYDIVFLERNVDELVEIVCKVTGQSVPTSKPKPDRRDLLITPAVRGAEQLRSDIRRRCPTFDRIVARVARHLRSKPGN